MSRVEDEEALGNGGKDVALNRMTQRHESASTAAAKALRRACDCCRKRKVKCDGDDPCGPCRKASIRCAYLQPAKKKGPKGLRSARVLQALRRIDSDANAISLGSLSPDESDDSNYARIWSDESNIQNVMHFPGSGKGLGLPLHFSDETYQTSAGFPASGTLHERQQWTSAVEPLSPTADDIVLQSSSAPEYPTRRLSGDTFIPYIRLFCDHMFPIMPVIDREVYLNPDLYKDSSIWSSDLYCFLCAICAATVVQLDDSIPRPPPIRSNISSDELFANECMRERQRFDFVDSATTLSVMTSFFLFAYHGNHEHNRKAWHYLQESITFLENLNMDVDESYINLNIEEAKWRRRLYWLLFITERAYAVQRRKQTRLHSNIRLPEVFESENSQLLHGFVNLADLFSRVSDDFVHAWRGVNRSAICNEPWLAETQNRLDAAALSIDDVTETQQLDINVTRQWLHVLAWQLGVSNGLLWGQGHAGMNLNYPVELARKVVMITSSADPLALDSHGIGMEQKLSDIAGCLADVLKCTAGNSSSTFLEGKQHLNTLLQRLSSMRGKESRYLRPLMSKMDGTVMGYELNMQPSQPFQALLAHPRVVDSNSSGGSSELGRSSRVDSSRTGLPGSSAPMDTLQQAKRLGGDFYDGTDAVQMMMSLSQEA